MGIDKVMAVNEACGLSRPVIGLGQLKIRQPDAQQQKAEGEDDKKNDEAAREHGEGLFRVRNA
jgi:hypothetical protein